MKKLYLKLLVKVFEKAIKKAGFSGNSWKFLLQTLISILTAILSKPPYERNPDFTGSSANMIF